LPEPIALCLEDLDAPTDSPRYLQCVAIAGTEPGLTLSSEGAAHWKQPAQQDVACELWVSQDERLILFRPEGTSADPVVLWRGGRSLTIPEGKPVVLVDQDQLQVGPRRLRLHLHGEAPAVHPPTPFVPEQEEAPESGAGRAARVAATALAIGAAVGVGGCKKEPEKVIEVRDRPPKVAAPRPDRGVQPDTRPEVDMLAPDTATAKKPPPKVDVRVRPPRVARPKPPKEPLKPLDKPSPKKKAK
jgi:hypothetical protein